MFSVCLGFLLAPNLSQSVPITEFGSKVSYHHDHKVDRVFVTTKLEQQGVHISCKETGHDFIAKFPRDLKYCRVTFLSNSENQKVYRGDGMDTKGVICDFWLKVARRDKTGES